MPKRISEENRNLRSDYEESRQRDLADYMSLIGQGFTSNLNRLSKLLGDTHELSVGRYKERLLMKVIADFIPKRYSVGSGFVIFPGTNIESFSNTSSSQHNHDISRELDIIVYDSLNYSTVFKDEDFVIVKPESVRAIIEVKGYLNNQQINDFMEKFIDFYKKWNRAYCLYETLNLPKLKCPKIFVMNWSISIDKGGRLKSSGKRLMKSIVKRYRDGIGIPQEKDQTLLPVISSAFIYNDCIITFASNFPIEGNKVEVGYSISSGKFTKRDKDGNLITRDDRTIAYLLYWIDQCLDISSNTLITRPDCIRGLDSNIGFGFEKWYDEEYDI
jgi:hypothetical protein